MERKKNKQQKLHLKKGDQVRVITGNDKGKEGKVLEIVAEKQRAFVEGANIVSRHTKPNAKNPNGGIVKQEAAIHRSEEHTSELQSLMRIAYAVICLKKKRI